MEGNVTNDQKEKNTIEIELENNNIQEKENENEIKNKNKITDNQTIKEEQNEKKENEKEKEKEKIEEEKKEPEEDKYNLNRDYNFLSILQFVNLFHKVLGLSTISTTELEFSLLHTDIDPLCCNILSKLLLKKEQHRPTKQNKDKDKDKEKDNNNSENNNINNSNEKYNNQKEKDNNNNVFNEENKIQLNETLLKKLNYFYKVYVRYLRKIYNITELSKSLDMIKNDIEIYNNNKYENDYYSFTKQNLSNKYYDDCDIKTELIVKLFRDLNGEHPLRPISNYHELEILMSNKDVELTNSNYKKDNIIEIDNNDDNNNTNNFKTFESLKTKQKVTLLMFFCNYCMSFSGRQPLYYEEIVNNKEESFISNKKIMPFYCDKDNYNNYIFPLNKDCRIYKEKINDIEINKSITESFDIKIKNYEELEKLLEQEKDQYIIKKLKEKLIEFKTNDEEEQKKINSNLKKEEIYQKAKKLREMNQNCTSEVEKYKNKDFLLMNLSNHMMTRRQLSQITQLSQVTTRNKSNQFMREKPKELTEEEKHRLKVQRENLEREKRMQKRNQLIEKMQREEEYRLTHPEEAKYLNNKKKRDKKKHKKKYNWSDEEESEYDENDYEDELMENYNNSDNEKKAKTKKKNNTNSIIISDDDEEDKIYSNKNKKSKTEEMDENYGEENNTNESEIINEGNLIYRYSSNQIELEGNWYVASDPSWKERVSYLFSGSQLTKQINLNIENTDVNVFMCSANLIECLQMNSLFKSCLEFLAGDYSGYFMYYSKTIEDRFNINLEIQDSLVKVFGSGTNSLGNFNLNGYMNFYRNKEVIIEKNNIQDQTIKIAEFKINKIYTMFNPTENEKVIKSYNHRRKKNDSYGEDY